MCSSSPLVSSCSALYRDLRCMTDLQCFHYLTHTQARLPPMLEKPGYQSWCACMQIFIHTHYVWHWRGKEYHYDCSADVPSHIVWDTKSASQREEETLHPCNYIPLHWWDGCIALSSFLHGLCTKLPVVQLKTNTNAHYISYHTTSWAAPPNYHTTAVDSGPALIFEVN